jgi:pyruvate/2-oxoglutarate dehydrogenase complex dihydrolipoamide dehydrogenase (E3) component
MAAIPPDPARSSSPTPASGPAAHLRRGSYDLIVIGGGSAGLSAAELAATLGARVALLDREKLGGECLYTGCVPSKALLHVARVAAQTRWASTAGLDIQLGSVDLGRVADYVERAIGQVYEQSDAPSHFTAQGIDIAFGVVRFAGPDRMQVNDQIVRARHVLIATGSSPAEPRIPGLAEVGFFTNETAFSLRHLPARLVVIGGGPIGCELGQAFARLGSQVTILQRPERLLPRDEPEASRMLQTGLEAEGVTIHTRVRLLRIDARGSVKVVAYETPDGMGEAMGDELLVAVGREPNVADLGLDAAGIRYDPRTGITVDRYLRTSNRQVYAAGDVVGGHRFTHAAALQARTAVRNALFPGRTALDERVMPWATFTEPEVAHVGLTEAQARERYGGRVRIFAQNFRSVDRAITDGATEGFVKLIALPNGRLLGAQIVGAAAGESINELALALAQGLGLAQLASATHVYPTFSLAIQQAAGQYAIARTARSPIIRLIRRLES